MAQPVHLLALGPAAKTLIDCGNATRNRATQKGQQGRCGIGHEKQEREIDSHHRKRSHFPSDNVAKLSASATYMVVSSALRLYGSGINTSDEKTGQNPGPGHCIIKESFHANLRSMKE